MTMDNPVESTEDALQKPIGAPPATLIHIGEQRVDDFSIQVTDYDETHLSRHTYESPDPIERDTPYRKRWIVIKGLHAAAEIEVLCKTFHIHPLIIEDILNTKGMPKIDEHDDYLFIRAKIPLPTETYGAVDSHQLSIILLNDTVLTFLEDTYAPLEAISTRLNQVGSRIRNLATDYLTWAILDTIVDTSLAFALHMEETLEQIEEQISTTGSLPELSPIHGTRREIAKLHRIVRPIREIVNHVNRSDSHLLTKRSNIFFQDLMDHTQQAIEMAEYLREHASSIKELYFTTTSHKMNEVMTVLACVSAIFLPLTFLAGIYGMNFSHMPELDKPFAYPLLISLFLTIAALMYRYFKKREWL